MSYEIKSAGAILKEKYKTKRVRKVEKNSLYKQQRWRRLSSKFRKENPICATPDCGFLSDDVDHIIPWKEGGSMWNEDNFQALCKSCHAIKSAKDRNKFEE